MDGPHTTTRASSNPTHNQAPLCRLLLTVFARPFSTIDNTHACISLEISPAISPKKSSHVHNPNQAAEEALSEVALLISIVRATSALPFWKLTVIMMTSESAQKGVVESAHASGCELVPWTIAK